MSTDLLACCAHIRVEYRPVNHADGSWTQRWVCVDCDHEFSPVTPAAHLPPCDICGHAQHEPGALLFSAPDKNGRTDKQHVCVACYHKLPGQAPAQATTSASVALRKAVQWAIPSLEVWLSVGTIGTQPVQEMLRVFRAALGASTEEGAPK